MGRFPSSAHLSSWAGICPGNHESAGKRRSGKTRRGNRWIRTDQLCNAGIPTYLLPERMVNKRNVFIRSSGPLSADFAEASGSKTKK
jgi:transposase